MGHAYAKRALQANFVRRVCVLRGYTASNVTSSAPATWTTLIAVIPCLESVAASQAGPDSTVMKHALLDSMGKLANRSAAAKMGLTVTV